MSKTNTKVDTPAASLEAYAGQWVVIQDEKVIEHGPDLTAIVEKARARGIRSPRVFFVEPRRARTVRLGL